jgi:poly(3-hydroxybutyrate) depolymerase
MTHVEKGARNSYAHGLKRLDDPRNYIFVAPQGIDDGSGAGWANTNGRDLTFTDDMIKAFTDDLCIDKSRIFAGGFSYGGMWSSTLACQRTEVFRALAPQNGSASCSSPKPVAFICFGSNDGTKDSLQKYARGIAKANGCADPNQTMPLPELGSKLHTCTSFDGCPPALPVRFCAFDENHKSTPCDGCGPEEDNGETSWLPGEIWNFFNQF